MIMCFRAPGISFSR